MSKTVKKPNVSLRVKYVHEGGSKIVRVQPKSSTVSLEGAGTWKFTRNCIFPKEQFDLICVDGQSHALPVWGAKEPVSSVELDSVANNNLLEQEHRINRSQKAGAVSWLQVGLMACTLLAVIGMGITTSGDMKDLQIDMARTHAPATYAGDDVTVVQGGQAQQGQQAQPGQPGGG